MRERSRFFVLMSIMVVVSLVVVGVTIYLLYDTALDGQRARLVETAQSQARLIEAVAQFNAIWSQGYPEGGEAATMSQITDAHERYQGFGETGEFTLAKREGNYIVFLLRKQHQDLKIPEPVTFESELAEPMRRALSGLSGTIIGLDYHGELVLAAYEPVAVLDLGIVAKIDITEVRAPFVRAGMVAGGIAILVILIGTFIFMQVSNPIIRRLQESEERYRIIFTQARDGIVLVDRETGHIINCNPEFESQTGRQLKQLKRMTIWQVRPPEKIEATQKKFFEIKEGGMGGSSELDFQKPDGEIVPIEFLTAAVTIQGRDYLQSITRDITERRQTEAEIRKLSHAVEQSASTVMISDTKGNIEYINPKFTEITGYAREEVIGKNPRILKSGTKSSEEYKELWETLISGRDWRGEFQNKKKSGELYIESATISPIRNAEGVITHFMAVKEDITERKRTEEALRKAHDELESRVKERTAELTRANEELQAEITERKRAEDEIRLLLETTQAISESQDFRAALVHVIRKMCQATDWDFGEVWVPSLDGKVLELSPAWYSTNNSLRKFGQLSEGFTFPPNTGLPGRVWSSKRPEWIPDVSSQPVAVFPRAPIALEAGLKAGFGVPIIADGQVLAVLEFFRLKAQEEDSRLVELVSSVATQLGSVIQRKQAEKELENSREQLRNLSTHLQAAREEERTRIAREIHDELGQALTALKMDMSWLGKRLPNGQELLLEKVGAISALVDTTIQTVKRISTELRPGVLDDLGLSAAIEWQAGEFQNRTGIKCEVSLEPEDIVVDEECTTAIYRIFQETLTNVVRHAKATRVRVSLKEKTGKVVLKVRDNGKGIAEEQISSPVSLGLIGMRERAYYLGGEIKISGIRDKGTAVTVSIPLDRQGKTR